MENFKRSVKRLLTRLTILGLVVICGAIAIAQVQKQNNANAADASRLQQTEFTTADSSAVQEKLVSGLTANVQSARSETMRLEPGRLSPDIVRGDETSSPSFVEDPNVRATQAVAEFNGGAFDSPFPAEGSSVPEPEFGNEPNFDDVPEFLGSDAPAPPEDGPSFAGSRFGSQQDRGAAEDAAFPDANENELNTPRFGGGADEVSSRFGNEASGQVQTPINPMRAGQPPADTSSFARQPAQPYDDRPETAAGNDLYSRAPAQDESFASPEFDDNGSFEDGPPSYNDNGYTENSIGQASPVETRAVQNSVSLSGMGEPGPRELEGPQSAVLSIHKIPPKQVRVGEPATFQVKIRNNGSVAAARVIIRDQVPKGTRLVSSEPQAKAEAGGGIYWEIGELSPNQDVTVSMQVIPEQEGLIGSVAVVSFETMASAQVEARRPMLEITHTAEKEVLVGETVRFSIAIDNPGSGTARDVKIEEDVPEGLSHSRGPRLEYKVGDIPAAGQRRLELSLKAAKPGIVTNIIRARGANGLIAEHTVQLKVIAPELKVRIEGPSTRYLERPATYTVILENPGTAKAENINLALQLPGGLKFVSTDGQGRFDSSTNNIRWLLQRLEPGRYASVKLTVKPLQKGQFNLDAVATANRGLRDNEEHPLKVEGIAALLFEVADQVDPIEVGGVTTYSIQVTNQGTEDASDVRFVAQLPPGMSAVLPTGRSNYQIQGNQIHFEPIARLAAKEKSAYTVQVKGMQAGDQRFKVRMTSADMTSPVIEEESTRVYSDQ